MNLNIMPASVTEALIAERGWEAVQRGTFAIGPCNYTDMEGGDPAGQLTEIMGFTFTIRGSDKIVTGQLKALLAVIHADISDAPLLTTVPGARGRDIDSA